MPQIHFLLAIWLIAFPALAQSADKSPYRSLVGFGANKSGFQPAHIYVVSNLADSGPGSLREAINAEGPRIVVFEVSGSIRLKRPLAVKKPYIAVAGETAPSPGIAVIGDRVSIETHDVIVRHIRFFVGDTPGPTSGSQRDALAIVGTRSSPAERIVIDHCSLGGAVDENLSTNGTVRNITISNSIIGNSLNRPISSARHGKGEHGKGVLIGDGTKNFSLIRSLIANNQDRNPRVKQGAEGEMINCVVYGWGGTTGWNVFNLSDPKTRGRKPVYANIIGNTYIAGPDGRCDIPFVYPENIVPGSRIFLRDNFGPVCSDGSEDRLKIDSAFLSAAEAIPPSPRLSVLPREAAYSLVLREAGPRPADQVRDDLALIRGVIERTGRIKKGIWGYRHREVAFPRLRRRHRELIIPPQPTKVTAEGHTVLEKWLSIFSARVEKPRPL